MPGLATQTEGTVLVTGAARRIGRAIALDLAARGWRVGIHYQASQVEAEALREEILRSGGTSEIFSADLACGAEVDALVPACAEVLGPVTCLVNNASTFLHDSVDDMSPDVWDRHISINLKAPVFLARALYRQLPDTARGNVINIIDQRVWRLTPEFFSYTISKSGLWTATRTLAQAMAPKVRVNAIGPGPVLRSIHQTDADFAAESASTLIGRGPTPGELADAVRFILSAPAMTGQMIALDGGQHLAWCPERMPAGQT
ncbi:MAG: SDR family oxidoreductase [Hyphomicrobiaceae bacterium]|nr:SDR family oxidoreductase [Hyphomicrobiaceae bacterium]